MAILDYSKEIASVVVGALGLAGKLLAKPRTSMGWGNRTLISHILPPFRDDQGNVTVEAPQLNVGSFLVRNTGKVPLTQIEVVLNSPPQSLNIWPPRPFVMREIEHRRVAILVDYLPPGEEIWFEMVGVDQDVPPLISVRSKEAIARPIDLALQPVAPTWMKRVIQTLCLFGIVAVVYIGLWLMSGLLTGNWTWLGGRVGV